MHTIRALVALIVVTLFGAAPAAAQGFEAKIFCNGSWHPGDKMPFTVMLEDLVNQQHLLDVTVHLTPPVAGRFIRRTKTFALGANQVRRIHFRARVPLGASPGPYSMSVNTKEGGVSVAGMCGFDVV